MKIDLTKPLEVVIERFAIDNKMEDVNPYMVGKIIRKKYEQIGYTVVQCGDFESNLLVEFVREFKFLDKYLKVKLGQYKKNPKVDDYNKQMMKMFQKEDLWKLLFICRLCSYLGDPSFPDIAINKDDKTCLRYVYSGENSMNSKSFFILLSKLLLDIEIRFSAVAFSDFSYPDKIQVEPMKVIEDVLSSFSKRVNPEDSKSGMEVDLSILKKWLEEKSADSDSISMVYRQFIEGVVCDSRLSSILERAKNLGPLDLNKSLSKPERLAILREKMGINMMEANELLVLDEILK